MEIFRRQAGVVFMLLVAAGLLARPAPTTSKPNPTEAKAASPGGSDETDACDAGAWLEDYRKRYGTDRLFRHLVALVPDPVESGHNDYFDLVREGVEEAVATGHGKVRYVRDRHWFPWPGGDEKKQKHRCWETEPGVILYRPSGNVDADPVAVFLVGETPTWGLRVGQFERALQLIDRFGGMPDQEAEYRILGPTFSGTAASLSAAIRLHSRPHLEVRRFSVVSGTASNRDVETTMERGDGLVKYESAAPGDDAFLGELEEFLVARGGRCQSNDGDGNIVLFTESLTTYGEGATKQKQEPAGCFIEWKFPPDLDSIRKAYESGEDAGGATPPRSQAERRDTAAKGMSESIPGVHDLALGEVLRRLSAKRVRFVGIVATDARDVVFLARRIRKQLPDIRLFTLGADIRYLHQTNAAALNGMLIAHSNRDRSVNVHSTSLTIELVRSVFLAGRHVLEDERIPEPSVRISFIGNGKLWQIGPDSAPPPSWVPRNWWASFWFFACAGLGMVVLVLVPWLRGVKPNGRVLSLAGRCACTDLDADDVFVSGSLLVVSACPVALMAVSRWPRKDDVSFALESQTCIGIWSLLVFFVLIWVGVFILQKRRPRVTTIILTVSASIAAVLSFGLASGPRREATFNVFSGGSPLLGGIIGLMSFALALWCARVRLRMLDTHRFGVADNVCFAAMEPPIAQALGDTDSIRPIERSLLGTIYNPWRWSSPVPILVHVLLAMSIAVPFIVGKPPLSFEAGWRNGLFVVFGCVAVLPVTGNLARLLVTWFTFHRLLRRLATLPIVSALGRLPAPLARPLEAQLTQAGNDVTDLIPVVSALGRLAGLSRSLEQRHAECDDLLRSELRGGTGDNRAKLVDGLLSTSSELARSKAAHSETTRALIDDFVAALIAVFIPRYVRHFRLFVMPLLIGSLVSVVMTSLYFVQPQRLIATLVFVWVAAIVFMMFVVYLALCRDPVIGAIAKNAPGAGTFTWGLIRRIIVWGVVPLASLLSAQYPDFASRLSEIVETVASAFR